MCSIFKYQHLVGRNFDYEVSYNEELRLIESMEYGNEYRILGMCTGLVQDYPLLYDGLNEKGLCCGALAFTGNAKYNAVVDDCINIPSFDFVFQILSSFESVSDVKSFFDDNNVNISDKQFSDDFPNSDMHWFIADSNESIIVEQTEDRFKYYEGSVMTNNPPYPKQVDFAEPYFDHIGGFHGFRKEYESRGMNTINLVGDYTSEGRFIRLSYLKYKLESSDYKSNPISQAFHLCSSVEQIYGVTPVEDKYEYTIYSIVYDMENLVAYLKFYDDLNRTSEVLSVVELV